MDFGIICPEVIFETLRMVVIDTENYGMKRENACGQNHGEQPESNYPVSHALIRAPG